MTDLLDDIASWAHHAPARPAHVWRHTWTSYAELWSRSDALACHLLDTLPRQVPVAVYGHKQPAMTVAFLACLKAGHPYIPIDAALPPARIDQVLGQARAALVLAPTAPAPTTIEVPQLAGEALDAVIAARLGDRPPVAARCTGEDVAYIMFTSGSTGAPKGVQITMANLGGFVAWARAVHPIGTGRAVLNQAPFSFDLSIMDLYLALTTGGTLHCVDRAMIENPLELRALLAATPVEIWVSTPSFAEMCLADRRLTAERLPHLRCFLFCGETLTPACVRQLRARFPAAHVYNLYGPTEATVAVTSILVDDALLRAHAAIPLGTPRPDTRLLVCDPEGREVAPGCSGEIVIEGPCVSPGYLHAPELTARAFAGPRYRTGDGGHYEGDALIFEGRLDSQVKLAGHRIELDDIAHNLEALPSVQRAVVIPVVREGRTEALAAFVVLEPGARASTADLKEQLARRVPAYMVPRDVVCRPELPMTANGKLDRARLARELAAPLTVAESCG